MFGQLSDTVILSDSPRVTLPDFVRLQNPDFSWDSLEGPEVTRLIDEAHEHIKIWKRNLFLVPSGKAGKDFITELTHLLRAYADS